MLSTPFHRLHLKVWPLLSPSSLSPYLTRVTSPPLPKTHSLLCEWPLALPQLQIYNWQTRGHFPHSLSESTFSFSFIRTYLPLIPPRDTSLTALYYFCALSLSLISPAAGHTQTRVWPLPLFNSSQTTREYKD